MSLIRASILICAAAVACLSAANAQSPGLQYHKGASDSVALIKALSNDSLSVKIYSNSAVEVEDRKNNSTWTAGPIAIQDKSIVEEGQVWLDTERSPTRQYPGRFFGKVEGESIRFELLGRQEQINGRFLCNVSLDGPWLIYKVLSIDDSIPSLVYPPPIQSDAIIIPKGVGEIIRTAERGASSRYIYPFYTRLNMRWLGGLKGDAAWIGIFDEGFEDTAGFVAERTATPILIRSLNRWSHSYTYRMKFVKGDYVDLAKIYRQWLMDKGQFVSLRQKIQTNPNLKALVGGRVFWLNVASAGSGGRSTEGFVPSGGPGRSTESSHPRVAFTYKNVAALIERLKILGLKKGLIKVGGWINGGYDYSHPDIWPPEPSVGPIADLKNLLASPNPILVGLHDNYGDMYAHTPSFPKGVNRNADGDLLTGGVWGGGQAYILSSPYSLTYAQRNWEDIRALAPKAMFIDTVTAMQIYQSFEPGAEVTKAQDLAAKTQLLAFYKKQGVLLGSEESADFGVPYVDWFENRDQRVQGRSIPLWPLVFHDAVFGTRYGGVTREGAYPGWLEDMLWGYLPHFRINSPDWNQDELFRSLDHVDQWNERIGTTEMTSHKFLTSDYTVEQTAFSTGDSIICNFGDKPYDHNGKLVKPKSYLILN